LFTFLAIRNFQLHLFITKVVKYSVGEKVSVIQLDARVFNVFRTGFRCFLRNFLKVGLVVR
jgi:hypothetical protein